MGVELSRRAGRVANKICEIVGFEEREAFVLRVLSVETFEELSKEDQDLIIKAEKQLEK